MDKPERRHILVAMEPTVLEGALAVLLEAGGHNDVVQFHGATENDRSGPYDAAIVTIELLDDVRAGVVITLPSGGPDAGVGHVITGGVDREVQVKSQQQVIDLLDEQFPTGLGPRDRTVVKGLTGRAGPDPQPS